MNKRADQILYSIGKFIWIPICALGIIFGRFIFDSRIKNNSIFDCVFLKSTGLPCPGCGGTRAVVFLFKGDFLKSFCYNPTVIYCCLAYLHFMLLCFYRKNIKKDLNVRPVNLEIYLFILAGVIVVQWIIKLILIFFVF